MIINGHNHCDLSDNLQKCQDYLQGLEEERLKIQVFQRELPLCLHLVTQAIETCKQQLSGPTSEYNLNGGQSECSEQTSSDVPVFEEFIPLKRASSHDSDDVDEQQNSKKLKNVCSDKSSKKSDWLRSTQLWNQTPDPEPSKESISPRKVAVTEVKRNSSGGAFHPFKKDKNVGNGDVPPLVPTVPPPSTSSTAETGCSSGTKEDKDSHRKARRCWSPELHRRFLQALQQLGGAHVATPKQIRELMKVDGLTNDEVKSHLQKYRLHTRRPSPSNQNNNGNNAQTPQFVVVGGIWVPPEYAATMAAAAPGGTANAHDVYAPIATMLPPFQRASASPKERQSNSDERGGHSEGRVQSHSSATSSSTHTTTASPAY